jgi:hypothetical protein
LPQRLGQRAGVILADDKLVFGNAAGRQTQEHDQEEKNSPRRGDVRDLVDDAGNREPGHPDEHFVAVAHAKCDH